MRMNGSQIVIACLLEQGVVFGYPGGNILSSAADDGEFDAAFSKAFASRRPCIVDARVDIDEMILPMAIPGKPIDEQVMEWGN